MEMRVLKLIAAAAAATLAGAVVPASAQTTKVNVAHVFANDFLPAFMSKDNGCFEKQGLDVTLTLLPIINNIPATIVAGSTQIGATTPTVLLQATENGLDLVGVAGATRMMADNPTMSVVMRQDVKVSSVQDLKGKRIAAPGINSMAEVVLRKWLYKAGLKPGEVNIVEAPIPQMFDLLKGSTVDGVAIMEPIRSRIISANVGYRHPSEFFATTAPDALATLWISSGAWAKANAKAIAGFRACIAEGVNLINTNPEEAKKIEAKYVKANAPVYAKFEPRVVPADLKIHADIATELGLLTKPANLSALVLP